MLGTMRLPLKVFALLTVSLVFFVACGGGDGDESVASDPDRTRPGTTDERPDPTQGSQDEQNSEGAASTSDDDQEEIDGADGPDTPEIGPDGFYTEVQIDEDGEKHIVPWDRVMSGGVPKDGIPSIDEPQFAASDGWDELDYRDDGLVIGVEVDGERRAYPFQVLVWHEIVNDVINGKPLVISYCPLCGTAIVFERELDGELYEFGVSGKLYNSDLLMYDRTTDSLWSQITGEAVAGELTTTQLLFYPSEIMTWGNWKGTYPDSVVLTRETGHSRNYDQDPYGSYYEDQRLMFPANDSSERFDDLFSKTQVVGVEVDGPAFGAYPVFAVIDEGPVNDVLGDVPVLVAADPSAGNHIVVFERTVDGRELTMRIDGEALVDEETGTTWNFDGVAISGELEGQELNEIIPVRGFWFAWAAFHPTTELWEPDS